MIRHRRPQGHPSNRLCSLISAFFRSRRNVTLVLSTTAAIVRYCAMGYAGTELAQAQMIGQRRSAPSFSVCLWMWRSLQKVGFQAPKHRQSLCSRVPSSVNLTKVPPFIRHADKLRSENFYGSIMMSKLTFFLFLLSFPLTIFLYIWKQMKRPVMHWRWVLSPIWITSLILYGEYSFKRQFLVGAVPIFLILTIIFSALKLIKKVKWKWGWTLCPIWFWIVLNFGAVLHIISVNYLEPRGLPF